MITTVIVDFNIAGLHYYKNAPVQVMFLENEHRHLFQIKAGYRVSHNNRQKEIFITQGELSDYLIESYGSPCNFAGMSCEDIAEELMKFAREDDMVWCEVLEDGKGGAKVEI